MMGAAGTNFWQSGVLLIPIILLAIVAGLYLLSRYLENRTQGDLKGLRSELRRLYSRRKEFEYIVQAYSPDDPEPFGSRLERLLEQLAQVERQAMRLEQQLVRLQEGAHALSSNRWRATMGALFLWPPLRRGVAQTQDELQAAWQNLEQVGESAEDLSGIGWQVALQSRQARQVHEQATQLLEGLRARKLQGEVIEAAIRQSRQIGAALAEIPGYFLESEQQSFLEQVDIDGAARAYDVLEETQPALERLWEQAQAWDRNQQATRKQVEAMQRALDEARRTLENLPLDLEAAPIKKQLEGLQIVAQNLDATMSRLEIDSIELVAQEAKRITQVAQEVSAQLKRARRELAALEGVLDEIAEGFEKLPLRFAVLRAKSIHPIEWTHSFDRLAALNRQAGALVQGKRTRTPEQVQQELETVAALRTGLRELSLHYEQVETAHTRLLALLEGPDFKQLGDWLPQARRLVEQAQAYTSENWPRKQAIAELPGKIEAMEKIYQRLAPANRAQPIGETEIVQRLDEAQKLSQDFQEAKTHLEQVQARLAEIQSAEKQAREKLETAQATLNQLAFIIRSNTFLAEIAASEANRLQNELQGLLGELGQRQRGSIEKKASQVEALVARIEQAANQWLSQLGQENQAAVKDLSAILADLDSIASLDEPAIAQAQRLLGSSQAADLGKARGKARAQLGELVQEFKSHSDFWQASAAAIHALQDVQGPVLDSYEQAYASREQSVELLTEVVSRLRQLRGWPPTSVSMQAEQSELEQIDAQWEALKARPVKALSLVQQLGNLSTRYQALGGKIVQSAERADRELDEIARMEEQIGELAQSWQGLLYELRDNPLASQEINKLLKSIERELGQIERDYKKGARDYNQVLQEMNAVYRNTRHFKVALDENRSIDAEGRVKTRR
ncbi:MAG: hypothetical protein JXA78_00250 [Anaerolineales bacterium]|nr:hypothetical protein [Anaerolineales bacterium]